MHLEGETQFFVPTPVTLVEFVEDESIHNCFFLFFYALEQLAEFRQDFQNLMFCKSIQLNLSFFETTTERCAAKV